jgi:hypothetical protein
VFQAALTGFTVSLPYIMATSFRLVFARRSAGHEIRIGAACAKQAGAAWRRDEDRTRSGQLDRTSRPRRLDLVPPGTAFAARRAAAFFRGGAVLARTTSDVVSSTRLLEVSVAATSAPSKWKSPE